MLSSAPSVSSISVSVASAKSLPKPKRNAALEAADSSSHDGSSDKSAEDGVFTDRQEDEQQPPGVYPRGLDDLHLQLRHSVKFAASEEAKSVCMMQHDTLLNPEYWYDGCTKESHGHVRKAAGNVHAQLAHFAPEDVGPGPGHPMHTNLREVASGIIRRLDEPLVVKLAREKLDDSDYSEESDEQETEFESNSRRSSVSMGSDGSGASGYPRATPKSKEPKPAIDRHCSVRSAALEAVMNLEVMSMHNEGPLGVISRTKMSHGSCVVHASSPSSRWRTVRSVRKLDLLVRDEPPEKSADDKNKAVKVAGVAKVDRRIAGKLDKLDKQAEHQKKDAKGAGAAADTRKMFVPTARTGARGSVAGTVKDQKSQQKADEMAKKAMEKAKKSAEKKAAKEARQSERSEEDKEKREKRLNSAIEGDDDEDEAAAISSDDASSGAESMSGNINDAMTKMNAVYQAARMNVKALNKQQTDHKERSLNMRTERDMWRAKSDDLWKQVQCLRTQVQSTTGPDDVPSQMLANGGQKRRPRF